MACTIKSQLKKNICLFIIKFQLKELFYSLLY